MDITSDGGGGLSPGVQAAADPRVVEAIQESEQLDRERQEIRLDVASLYVGAQIGCQEIHLGISGTDDHQVIIGLRRLVAIGAMAKGCADKLERTLPQPSRLFTP